MKTHPTTNRRDFFKKSLGLTAGFAGMENLYATDSLPLPADEKNLLVIGPREGYSPQIGTLVSMLNYNRDSVVNSVKNLTKAELDHLHDKHANSIGALILHLGAVEKFYQINTFENRQDFNEQEKKIWNAALNLGDVGRKEIKGKDIKFYLDTIAEVRGKTLQEFKKKDDEWLMAIDPVWSKPDDQVNTYWKWFHVCEHESNHRGQIRFLKSRLPGAKPEKE